MNRFSIGWMFPDTLNLHGERGNVLALARYAELAGMDHEVARIDFESEDFDPFEHDVLFMASGEISAFPEVIEWLGERKERLISYMEEGHPIVVTGTSAGMFFDEIAREDGSALQGLGILHGKMTERDHVIGNDIYFRTEYEGREMEILGSQISMADLEPDEEAAFGEVLYGYGNNGKDGKEGVIKGSSIFTNALGPVLVTNPWLTIEIVKAGAAANGTKLADVTGSAISADSFDLTLEKRSFELKKKYNLNKPGAKK